MVFDPSVIRRRMEPARDDRVSTLMGTLMERGLASNPASARRLAESMVETERKVLDQGPRRESPDELRSRAQQDPMFASAGVRGGGAGGRLPFAAPFASFVDRARSVNPQPAPARAPAQVVASEPERKQVFFDDAPPQERAAAQGYGKFQLEAQPDMVVVRRVEESSRSEIMVEQGVVIEDELLAPAISPATHVPASVPQHVQVSHGASYAEPTHVPSPAPVSSGASWVSVAHPSPAQSAPHAPPQSAQHSTASLAHPAASAPEQACPVPAQPEASIDLFNFFKKK